jgi:hypothetical protein
MSTAAHGTPPGNPRLGWEPGMGMIPDPPQIRVGDGGGDGPPIPGRSGMGMGMDPRSPANRGSGIGMIPDCRRHGVPTRSRLSRALHLLNG